MMNESMNAQTEITENDMEKVAGGIIRHNAPQDEGPRREGRQECRQQQRVQGAEAPQGCLNATAMACLNQLPNIYNDDARYPL